MNCLKTTLSVALCLSAMLLTGCSSFSREWNSALEQPVEQGSVTGPWEGTWLSAKNGHTGRLRCVLSQVSTNEYDAFFHATFWKVFRASYRVPLHADDFSHGAVTLTGTADLGRMAGGLYYYRARINWIEFVANYRSKNDRGTFEMNRPEPE